MSAPTLTTERLTLRGHHPDDLDALAAMWADPGVYAMIGGKPRAREEVWIRLLRSIGCWTVFGYGAWVVCDRTTGAVLGDIGLLESRRAIMPELTVPEAGGRSSPRRMAGLCGRGDARGARLGGRAGSDADLLYHRSGQQRLDPAGGKAGLRRAGRGVYHDRTIRIFHRG